jgi:nitrogen fixation protein FixH
MSHVSDTPRRSFRLTGRHVIGGWIAFFAAVAATDAVLIFLAVSTFSGLETPDAYRKGLAYNGNLAAARAQDDRGWREQVALSADGAHLAIAIVDRDGRGVDDLRVTAQIGRPATTGADRRLTFSSDGAGRYTASTTDLGPGTWIASIEARAADGSSDILLRGKARLWKNS